MAKTILSSNQKGGVGKSTTAAILAEVLAYLDKEVLILELEPQMNLSNLFSANNSNRNLSTADLFSEHDYTKDELMNSIIETPYPNIYMLPGSLELYNVPDKITTKYISKYIEEEKKFDPEYLYNRFINDISSKVILKNQLIKIQTEFDYIIIDSNPFKTIMNTNAMCMSDLVLIPIETDGYSYNGLTPLLDTYEEVAGNTLLNPDLPLPKIFITRAAKNTNNYKDFHDVLESSFGTSFLKTSISNDTKIKESSGENIPPLHWAPKSKACKDYIDLFKEAGLLTSAQHKKLLPQNFLQKMRIDK